MTAFLFDEPVHEDYTRRQPWRQCYNSNGFQWNFQVGRRTFTTSHMLAGDFLLTRDLIYLFVCFETRTHYYGPGWPWIFGNPLASVFPVLRHCKFVPPHLGSSYFGLLVLVSITRDGILDLMYTGHHSLAVLHCIPCFLPMVLMWELPKYCFGSRSN